ncbi:MAG TPA: NAD(P)H-hydrate epimerase [archaeon]|nr:NAD(P)H-hydrate epimerase [archaeon]
MNFPTISSEQMEKVDDLATRHFGLDLVQMMENAGCLTARLARGVIGRLDKRKITILVGKGNNGGDGIVTARHLQNWGAKVTVIIPDHPDNISKLNNEQLGVLRSMFVDRQFNTSRLMWEDSVLKADLVIDALLGYKVNRNPEGDYSYLIELVNKSKTKKLSIDVPSGLNPDSGEPCNPCIKADYTLALGVIKKGLLEKKAKEFVGKLYLGDVGIPKEVYQLLGIEMPNLFEKNELVRV